MEEAVRERGGCRWPRPKAAPASPAARGEAACASSTEWIVAVRPCGELDLEKSCSAICAASREGRGGMPSPGDDPNARNPRICRAFPRSWSADLSTFRRGSLTRCLWEFSELFTIWEAIVVRDGWLTWITIITLLEIGWWGRPWRNGNLLRFIGTLCVCFVEVSIISFAGSSKGKAVSFCFKENVKKIVFASSFRF